MIVVDTNIISALMAPVQPDAVVDWFDTVPPASIFATTVTKAEILYGIRILPDGKRKAGMEVAAELIFSSRLQGRMLPFDEAAADIYPQILAERRAKGRPMSQFDAQIASIALSRGAAVATRNVADFSEIDLDIINPWDFRA